MTFTERHTGSWPHASVQLAKALGTLGVKEGDGIAAVASNNHRYMELYQQLLCMEAPAPPFSSRVGNGPQVACGPPKEMKNTFCPATALQGSVTLPFVIPTGAKRSGGTCCSLHQPPDEHRSIALPFVIPSAAEGSAVPRTFPGNVFSTEY
jgi:hypothetical protein